MLKAAMFGVPSIYCLKFVNILRAVVYGVLEAGIGRCSGELLF